MKKIIILAASIALFSTTAALAGEKSEKVGEVAGKAAKETQEAGKLVIKSTKKKVLKKRPEHSLKRSIMI